MKLPEFWDLQTGTSWVLPGNAHIIPQPLTREWSLIPTLGSTVIYQCIAEVNTLAKYRLSSRIFFGGGKIYCYVNLYIYAIFSVVFGPHFGGTKDSEGGKLLEGVGGCGRKPEYQIGYTCL